MGENKDSRKESSGAHLVARWLSIALIVAATAAAYANSLRGPFVLDDLGDIVDNPSIRHLWPLRDVFVVGSAGEAGLHSRPVVNLTWAVNYAMSGLDTMPYHLTNLAIHILAALTLFGIVHRTLSLPGIPERLGRKALPLGLAAALIWALHPLQTQAVTYVTQRYESLMGLCYLAALYSLIRAGSSAHGRAWAGACAAAAMLAMGSKEVAVSAPIILLLYDRAFLAGSVRGAWARRRGLYLGLLGVWLGFALLQLLSASRSSWSGYGKSYSLQEYALSQFGVILHYLRLSLWPQPLVLDYGWPVARSAREILPGAVVVGGLAAASVWALARRPKLGLLGAWFFLILAPTSSILPVADLAFLHRMYLPLAAIVLLAVLGGEAAVDAAERRGWLGKRGAAVALSVVAAAAVALAAGTWRRNRDFESAVSIWLDTVAKAPGNVRALNNLGTAYTDLGNPEKAVGYLQQVIRLKPDDADAFNNLGMAHVDLGNPEKAVVYLREAIRLKPDDAKALNNLATIYVGSGQLEKAAGYLQEAVRLKPDYADALNNLGSVYGRLGQFEKSLEQLRRAIEARPDFSTAHFNLGVTLVQLGRYAEATAICRTLREIDPPRARELESLIPGAAR